MPFRLTKNKVKTKTNNFTLTESVSVLFCDEKFTIVIISKYITPIKGTA